MNRYSVLSLLFTGMLFSIGFGMHPDQPSKKVRRLDLRSHRQKITPQPKQNPGTPSINEGSSQNSSNPTNTPTQGQPLQEVNRK